MIDVEEFLTGLGVTGISRASDEVYFCCPFHGDSNPSASMKVGSGIWFCFVCHKGGTAVTFLSDYSGIAPIEAARRVREMADLAQVAPVKHTLLAEVDDFLNRQRAQIQTMPEAERAKIDNWFRAFSVDWDLALLHFATGAEIGDLAYPFGRGFLPKTLIKYDIGYDALSRRMIITMRDFDGNVVGFKGRDVTGVAKARYLILGTRTTSEYGFAPYRAGDHVYLLDSCDTSDPIIVCEGELNALMLRQYGYGSAVAVSGSYVSEIQVAQVLMKSRAPTIVLFFDDDEAGRLGAQRAAGMFEKALKVLVVGPHRGDPVSMDYSEIDALLQCARSSLSF
jgi:DNA primase